MPNGRSIIYGIYWLLVSAAFVVFAGMMRSSVWRALVLYAVFGWLPLGAIAYAGRRRLMRFLEAHHREVWEELTSSGKSNDDDLKFYPFIFKTNPSDEPELARMKAEQCRTVLLALVTLLLTLLVFLATRG